MQKFNNHIHSLTLNFLLTDVFGEEHDKEWNNEVVNPLHIATGGMPDRPYKQDAFEKLIKKKKKKNENKYEWKNIVNKKSSSSIIKKNNQQLQKITRKIK